MTRPSERRAAWNWLPIFLSVAESGSIAKAGRELGLTPAAVSRTIRLLEEQLGRQLFQRRGRALELNAAGLRLRAAVRAAIDEVDLGIESLAGDPISGRLRVAAHGSLAELAVLPSLLELRVEHPSLVPEQVSLPPNEAREGLARGRLDVAFFHDFVAADSIEAFRVGTELFSVYCGRDHPMYGQGEVGFSSLRRHAFCAPPQLDNERSSDGWPSERPRTIGMRVSLLHTALRVALRGALLVALPDAVASEYVRSGELEKLTELPPRQVYAIANRATLQRPSVLALVERVESRLRGPGNEGTKKVAGVSPS